MCIIKYCIERYEERRFRFVSHILMDNNFRFNKMAALCPAHTLTHRVSVVAYA